MHEQCAQVALSYGGVVDTSASDRLMVYFGWPSALEDVPGRALIAVLEMMAVAQSIAADRPITLRIGIATSDALTRGSNDTGPRLRPAVIGEPPALATRMQLRAPPSGILVAESTRRMTGAAFQFLAAGELDPGEGGSLMWRLLGVRSATTRFLLATARCGGRWSGGGKRSRC
jgi:class 3 adenylate cyclase